jgi:hypothetical protein
VEVAEPKVIFPEVLKVMLPVPETVKGPWTVKASVEVPVSKVKPPVIWVGPEIVKLPVMVVVANGGGG